MCHDAPETPVEVQEASKGALLAPPKDRYRVDPYRVIHRVRVPLDKKDEAAEWLKEHFGPSAAVASTTRNRTFGLYDPGLLTSTSYVWDGFVMPYEDILVFRVKDNDQLVMIFKLMFGGIK